MPLTENEPSPTSTQFLEVIEQNQQLKASLAESARKLGELRKSLEIMSTECSQSRRQVFELKKRVEVLGLFDPRPDNAKLEETFLKSVSELQVLASENESLKFALLRLSEAAQRFSITSDSNDADARLALEAETRKANEAIGVMDSMLSEGLVLHPTLQDGLIVSVMENLSIVVANLGKSQGIKVGMPLRITRAEKVVAGVRVVDAREKIAGAMIQHLSFEHDRIRIGDHVSIDTTK